jgi:hypothetical protein
MDGYTHIRVTCTNVIVLEEAVAQLREALADMYPGKLLPPIYPNVVASPNDFKSNVRAFDIVVRASPNESYSGTDRIVDGYTTTEMAFNLCQALAPLMEKVNAPKKRSRGVSVGNDEMSCPKRRRVLDHLTSAMRLLETAIKECAAPEASPEQPVNPDVAI